MGSLTIDVGATVTSAVSSLVNIAVNSQNDPQLSQAFASYTSPHDDARRVIDGNIWRTGIPQNTRWTSFGSPSADEHVGVDLRSARSIDNVRLYFYDYGGGVRIPSSYDLQYWTAGGSWTTVPAQTRSPGSVPSGSNERTTITFPAITTSQLRVVAPNPGRDRGDGTGWGLSEFEVWVAPSSRGSRQSWVLWVVGEIRGLWSSWKALE
jgi:hypothetical protein